MMSNCYCEFKVWQTGLISVFAESNDGSFVMQRLLYKQMNGTVAVCGNNLKIRFLSDNKVLRNNKTAIW